MSLHNSHPIPRRYVEPAAVAKLKKLDIRLRALAASLTGDSGFLVLGPTGVGKTLAAAQGGALVAKNHNEQWVQWVRADELSRMLGTRGSAESIDGLVAARFLIVDELGYERFWEAPLEVIGARHDFNRPTLVTSGRQKDGEGGFLDRYGDATVRRIIEVGNGALIDCWKPASPDSTRIANEQLREAAKGGNSDRQRPSRPDLVSSEEMAGALRTKFRSVPAATNGATMEQRRLSARQALEKFDRESRNA